jgi:hypothetical protein
LELSGVKGCSATRCSSAAHTSTRMRAAALEARDIHLLRTLMLRYALFWVAKLSRSAVCSRFHSIRQRLCRWLPACYTRRGRNNLTFTQEVLSHTLGARRLVVTSAACLLQWEGATQYRRGYYTLRSPQEAKSWLGKPS